MEVIGRLKDVDPIARVRRSWNKCNVKYKLAYVGISRATDLAKLWLLNEIDDGFFNTHDDEREEISQEYARLLHLFPQGGTILDDPGGSGIGESACWNQGYES